LIVVSHDREFLNNVVTSALIFRKDSTIKEYVGGYDDWNEQIENSETLPVPAVKTVKKTEQPTVTPGTAVRKLTFKETRELQTLPARIESLEIEQQEIHRQLSDFLLCKKPGFVTESQARLAAIEADLITSFARWEELEKISLSSANRT
jgi:ATP-binding cassette subfamily F protein uup